STRKQLKTDAMWCYFDAFLSLLEWKNFKEAKLKSSWIEAIILKKQSSNHHGLKLCKKKYMNSGDWSNLKENRIRCLLVHREILDIFLKVENQEFTVPPSFESLVKFVLELGYKGKLTQASDIYVDQMHQLWRTFREGAEIANSEYKEDDTKGDDQKFEEEPKGDDQATEVEVGVFDLVKIKEKSEILQSTSSHSISSNFGNQFLVNSLNASFIGIIPENTDKEITSMMDIEIQQDVPLHLHYQPQKITFEKDVQEVKQVDHFAAIHDSIRSQVPSVVKDYLGTSLPDAFQKADFATLVIQKYLTEFELKKILMEKMKKSQSYQTADDKDEDPSAGPNPGKESKKRRSGKEAALSKISSTPKESTKGKPPSKSSNSGKSASADQSVKEREHEPEVLDPEWNTIKAIDDTPEQPWFNQMVQAVKPLLIFDELMSTPIDFLAFAMNRLHIDNITREVLVGLMFNLLKGTCKSCVELEYNMEECYRALTDQL
nr:hypothetical protein [Tanacetum cinerariifolium]